MPFAARLLTKAVSPPIAARRRAKTAIDRAAPWWRRPPCWHFVEWGTAGLVAQWLGDVAGADEVYQAGLVVRGASGLAGLLDRLPESDRKSVV